jgi:hypothetical protein
MHKYTSEIRGDELGIDVIERNSCNCCYRKTRLSSQLILCHLARPERWDQVVTKLISLGSSCDQVVITLISLGSTVR